MLSWYCNFVTNRYWHLKNVNFPLTYEFCWAHFYNFSTDWYQNSSIMTTLILSCSFVMRCTLKPSVNGGQRFSGLWELGKTTVGRLSFCPLATPVMLWPYALDHCPVERWMFYSSFSFFFPPILFLADWSHSFIVEWIPVSFLLPSGRARCPVSADEKHLHNIFYSKGLSALGLKLSCLSMIFNASWLNKRRQCQCKHQCAIMADMKA